MAVLSEKTCRRCGKRALCRFTPGGPGRASTWLCNECSDRRRHPRFVVKTGGKHLCVIKKAGVIFMALLIDLSVEGAQLEIPEEFSFVNLSVDEKVEFFGQFENPGRFSRYIPAKIRWIRGRRFGLRFLKSVGMSDTEIERIAGRYARGD